jgi:hypothetical protein
MWPAGNKRGGENTKDLGGWFGLKGMYIHRLEVSKLQRAIFLLYSYITLWDIHEKSESTFWYTPEG